MAGKIKVTRSVICVRRPLQAYIAYLNRERGVSWSAYVNSNICLSIAVNISLKKYCCIYQGKKVSYYVCMCSMYVCSVCVQIPGWGRAEECSESGLAVQGEGIASGELPSCRCINLLKEALMCRKQPGTGKDRCVHLGPLWVSISLATHLVGICICF